MTNKEKAEKWRDLKPKTGTLVVDLVEFSNPFENIEDYEILNWNDKKNSKNAKFFSKTGKRPFHFMREYRKKEQFRNETKYQEYYNHYCRSFQLRKIHGIIIHETAGNTSPADMQSRSWPENDKEDKRKAGAHFLISKNGGIIQFNDIMELANHGGHTNSSSVGIEFTLNYQYLEGDNESIKLPWLSWIDKKPFNKRSTFDTKIVTGKDGKEKEIKYNFQPTYKEAAIPNLDMVEKDFQLVQFLSQILIMAKGKYKERDNSTYTRYKAVEIKGKSSKGGKSNYVEFWKKHANFNFPENIDFLQAYEKRANGWKTIDWLVRFSVNPMGSKETFLKKYRNKKVSDFFDDNPENKIGITAHCSFHKNKMCGWFNSLYCWCRMLYVDGNGLPKDKAYAETKKILQTVHFNIKEEINGSKKRKTYKMLPVFKSKKITIENKNLEIIIWYYKGYATVYFKEKNKKTRYFLLKRTDKRNESNWQPDFNMDLKLSAKEKKRGLSDEVLTEKILNAAVGCFEQFPEKTEKWSSSLRFSC